MEVLLILAAAGLLAAGGALVAGLSRRSKEKALGEPRLVVSPAPYAFGEVVPCRLASVVRAPIRVERARFFLRCAESVRWTETETDGNGRRRSVERTQAALVWSAEETVAFARELKAGERFEAEVDLRLPEAGGPTFSAAHNEVTWQVAVSVEQAEGALLEEARPIVVEARRRFDAPAPPR